MPSGKSRSKDDTWKADELQKSLKEARADKPDRRKHRDGDDKEKRHRRREDDEGKERRHRDKEINGDDKERKHRKREGGEDEKERRRRPKEDDEKRRNKENEGGDDEKRRRHLEKDGGGEEGERRRKRPEGADEDGERRRRHRDKEGGDDEERKRKHREKEGGEDEERRRKHREKDGDDKERRRKPRDEDGAGERSRRRKDGEEDEERRRRRKEKEGEDDGKKDGDDERRRKRREKDGEDDEERRRRRKEREGDDEGRRKHRDDRRKEKDGEEEGKEDGKEKEERRRRRTEEGDEDREERRRHRKEEGDEDREERRRRRKEEGGDEDKEERRRRRKEEGDDEGRRRRHKEKDGEDGERRRRHRDKEGSGSRQRPKEGESEDGRQEGETETQETNGNENNQLDAVDSGPPPPADIHSEDQLAVAAKGPSEEKEEETKPKEVKEKTKPEKEPKKEVKHSGSKKITKPASKSSRSVTTRKTSTKVAVTSPVKAKEPVITRAKSSSKSRSAPDKKLPSNDPVEDIAEEINVVQPSSAEAKVEADGGDDYGDYEDDFEDYDDDFEDEDEEQEDNQLKKSREEMDDLFQAMNEENDRLLASSRDFSDSTDLSDERSKPSRPVTGHQRKFINFVSAKQRQVTAKTASKTRRRGQELLQLIEFDSVQFNLFDMPPVNEYELYMRSFGSSNTKQTYVQTNDDNLDREIQTEEIDNKQKWTQHPPEDFAGCGGDDNDDEEDQMSKGLDSVKLSKFLQRATQTILILLEEDYTERSQNEVKESQSSASFSQGFLQLETAPIVQGRHVTYSCFSPVQTNLLLTIHSQPSKEYDVSIDRRGFIYVWNINEPSRPIKYLVCESQPTCCCFSPSKATLVFAGMNDGTLVVWDLRETSSLHHTLRLWNEEWLIRNPTYSTAGVIGDENHHSAITTVLPIVSTADSAMSSLVSNEDVGSGLSFQLASLEENSIMHLWVVAEVAVPDSAGSESDLGLSPGGRIKLLKSSSVTLQHPSGRDSRLKATLRSFHMQLLPSNPNHYYVGTDSGMILHGTRHSGKVVPKAYKQEIDSPVSVTSIDFSPFDVSCFLAGCADGSLRIYNLTTELPAVVWPNSTNGQPIVSVQWSRSRPCVFYVLDKDSKFHIWDLSQNDAMPVKVEHFTSGRLTSFSLSNDHRATGLGLLGSRPKMVLCFDDGKTELHTVSEALGHLQPNEVEHLKNYIESAL